MTTWEFGSTGANVDGLPTAMIDALGMRTEYTYTTLGQPETITTGGGSGHDNAVETFVYNSDDQLQRQYGPLWDPADHTSTENTTYTRDDLGRVTQITQPDPDDAMIVGSSYTDTTSSLPRPYTTYGYDLNGNQTTSTNELGKTTTNAFDDLGRLVSRTDPDPDAGGSLASPVTSYTFDTLGQMLTLDDPVGNMTTWTYDTWGNVLTETNELSEVRTMEYDLLGQLTKRTDRLGRIMTFDHDLLGRLTAEKWWNSGFTTVVDRYDFGYDLNSQLVSADGQDVANSETWANIDYAYNDAGWRTSETINQPNYVTTTFTSGYELRGLRDSLTTTFSVDGGSTTKLDFENNYTFDAKGRIDSLAQTSSGSGGSYSVVADKFFELDFNDLDQITNIDRFNNLAGTQLVASSAFDRDYLGRVTEIDHYKSSTHFATFSLAWDAHSRITAIDDVFSNSAWNENHDFGYDHTDQLKTADHTVQSDEAYSFDVNGNRTGNQTHLSATTSSTVIANNRISTDGVYNYTWDDEGNLLTKTNISTGDKEEYTYDYRNRISLVTFKNSSNVIQKTVAYRFDHNNNLLRRVETPYSSGVAGTPTSDIFVTEGVQIVMAFHKGTSGNAALTDRFVWSPERDQLLTDEQVTSLSSAGTPYHIFGDQINSVRQAATYNPGTSTTSVAKNLTYDAFGNVTADSASGIILIFGYTARYKDSDTQLQFNGPRIYISPLGIWGQEDPIGFRGNDDNLRRYVANGPVFLLDPSGLQAKKVDPIDAEVGTHFGEYAKGFPKLTREKGLELKIRYILNDKAMKNARFFQKVETSYKFFEDDFTLIAEDIITTYDIGATNGIGAGDTWSFPLEEERKVVEMLSGRKVCNVIQKDAALWQFANTVKYKLDGEEVTWAPGDPAGKVYVSAAMTVGGKSVKIDNPITGGLAAATDFAASDTLIAGTLDALALYHYTGADGAFLPAGKGRATYFIKAHVTMGDFDVKKLNDKNVVNAPF